MTTNGEKIERLREHLNKHGHRKQVFVSVDALQTLLYQRDALKAQVERLIAKEGERIGKALREAQTSRLGVMDECDEEETG